MKCSSAHRNFPFHSPTFRPHTRLALLVAGQIPGPVLLTLISNTKTSLSELRTGRFAHHGAFEVGYVFSSAVRIRIGRLWNFPVMVSMAHNLLLTGNAQC